MLDNLEGFFQICCQLDNYIFIDNFLYKVELGEIFIYCHVTSKLVG